MEHSYKSDANTMAELKDIKFKKEVEIIVSIQAQKVINSSKYSVQDFIDWALNDQKISIGGHNATVFLEQMYNKEGGN